MRNFSKQYRRFMPYILAVYVVGIAASFLYLNMRLTVEWVALILFGAALLSGRALLFVRDWGVFFMALLAWQFTSGLALQFHFPWHLQEMIDVDRWMFFGTIPSVWMQQHLYHPGKIEPWDVFAVGMYMMHFLAPLLAGFVLWMSNRSLFQKYALTYVVVFLGGMATYILYPAAPPWFAGEHVVNAAHGTYQIIKDGSHGHVYLPGVQNLFNVLTAHWYNPYNGNIRPLGFLHFKYDPVGAIPSEHAAYPMLFFLFMRRQFGRQAYWALLYIAGLTFSIIYLGQHYVIDALIGFAYAIAGYGIVMHVIPAVRSRQVAPRPVAPPAPMVADLEEA